MNADFQFVLPVPSFRNGMGTAANWDASPRADVNLFPQFRAKSPERITPPPVEPPGLPQEEETKLANMVIPIQVSDAEYALLVRALCPTGTQVPENLPVEAPEPNAPAFLDGAGQPLPANLRIISPDRPPGTPIV